MGNKRTSQHTYSVQIDSRIKFCFLNSSPTCHVLFTVYLDLLKAALSPNFGMVTGAAFFINVPQERPAPTPRLLLLVLIVKVRGKTCTWSSI